MIISSKQANLFKEKLSLGKGKVDQTNSEELRRNIDQLVTTPNNNTIFNNQNPSSHKQGSLSTTTDNSISSNEEKVIPTQQFEFANISNIKSFIVHKASSDLPLILDKRFVIDVPKPKKLSFYIEPNVSVGFLQRKFSSHSMEDSLFLEKRTLENAILHDAVSLEFGALINEKWSVQLGLEYQEMREKFSIDVILQSDTTLTEVDDAFFFLDSEMDTIFVSGTQTNIVNGVRQIRHYNKHKYLNIPLNVSRRFALNKTFINASVGMSYAIKHDFSGLTKGFTSIEEDELFSLDNRLGFQLGLAAEYNISDNKQLFLKTIFRKSPKLGFSEGAEKSHTDIRTITTCARD
ncbi:hypothetical protein N9L92_03525 [Saprospiraceae bacterium]|nr:hypothetical protein [Saprospiraceae bacterium]